MESFKNMEELQAALNRQMIEFNATPNDDIDNLSPNDMSLILYKTFAEDSPIQYKKHIEVEIFDKIPFYNLFRLFLQKIATAGEVKLTTRGNLPKKLCLELYNSGILKEEAIERGVVKLSREGDSIILQNLKIIGIVSGLIKKRNNKLSLTKKGEKLFNSKDQFPLFKTLFETNAFKFNLGFHDGYPQNIGIQTVFGYTIYLLLQYGKLNREFKFYFEKNLRAFPHILPHLEDNWGTPEFRFESCYYIRVFERFLEFYGFLEVEKRYIPGEIRREIKLNTSSVFTSIFEIETANFRFKKETNQA